MILFRVQQSVDVCSADQALDRFAMKRYYDDKVGAMTHPSQRRYEFVRRNLKILLDNLSLPERLILSQNRVTSISCFGFITIFLKPKS